MKISLYIRGRACTFEIARGLYKNDMLNFLITSYPKFIVNKYKIPKKKIKSVFSLEIFYRFMKKINKIFKIIKLDFYPVVIIDWLADFIFSLFYIYKTEFILSGFGNSSLKTLVKSKKKNIKSIFFVVNAAPSFRKSVLENEYKQLGVTEYYNIEPYSLTKKINQSIQLADYVGCISSFQKQTYLDEGINENKIFTSFIGVDTSVFFPQNLKKEKFIVIAVGNDFIRKGFKYLIDGFNSLKLPNSELWLVGNIDKKLVSKTNKLEKNNIFFGSVNEFELPKLYNKATISCLPTLEDGAAIVLPQAMACGLPVISSKFCMGPDIIENEINGFILEKVNSLEISEKINFFYNNPEKTIKMGENALTSVEKRFSSDAIAKNIINFCENNKN